MTSVLLAVFVVVPASGVDAGLHERIERAVTAGDLESLRALEADIERKAGEQERSAEILYDLGYLSWRIGHLMDEDDRKERKRILKQAQAHLERALEEDPGNAEAMALRGSVIGERITGMFSGMLLGPRAGRSLKRAARLDPDNPRIALQRGIGFFFTPGAFGGGVEKAEELLRRSIDLFEKEPPSKSWPDWGRVDALAWLGRVLLEQDRLDEARSTLERALELEPDHAWVRDELLPALEAAVKGDP